MVFQIIYFLITIHLISAQNLNQVLTVSKGELYINSSTSLYYIDNITLFNLQSTQLNKQNLQITFTGWIQTKTASNLNNYQSKIQIFNQANQYEKLLFFGNNSTHFILRQDISLGSSRCTCELQHQQSSTYRFIVSILQNSSGIQLSLTLQGSDGSLQYCKQSSSQYINTNLNTYLIAFQAQKPLDSYIYSTEKMGDISILQNYSFSRDSNNSNLNEEKFLLWFNPSALQVFHFKFSYEQRDCNCIIDSSSNQIQATAQQTFGVLESINAGGYFIYTFTQNQEYDFLKQYVRFGQPMDNFYNSLNINNQSTSFETMSLIFSFWMQIDSTVQSFQALNYNSLNNQFQIKIKINQSSNKYQLSVFYQGIEYIVTASSLINPDQQYHIILQINPSYIDLYVNGIFNQRTPINLLNIFSSETSSGSFKIGGENNPAPSTGKLSQVRMFSSSSIYTNQISSINSLKPNCFTLVLERQQYTCILCQTGYFLNNLGECVSSCSSSENQMQSVGLCAPKCSYRCNTCSSKDPLICTSCSSQRVLKGTTCLCGNGSFEDYKNLSCNSVKKLTKGFEIGQFTFKSVNQLQVNFQNTFTQPPNVVFSILGYSVSDAQFGQFEVLAKQVTQISMTVTPGVTAPLFYLHVQYLAYEPSKYFYSDVLKSFNLLSSSGNYKLPSLGTYYQGKSSSQFNTHVFFGGYLCNPIIIFLKSPTCQFNVSVNSDKISVDIQVNSVLLSTSPTIYYLITPPEISSYNLGFNYNVNSIYQDISVSEKYQISQIPLTPFSSFISSLNPLSLDIVYSITNFNIAQKDFQYLKYQPNEITINQSGIITQNFEIYFNAVSVFSSGVQATVLFEQFSDAVCGVKDFYSLSCLYCQQFGYDPSTGCTTCLNTFQLSSGNCITPSGYYYDSVSNSNLPCDISCSSCTQANQCTQCKGQLVFNQQGLCSCQQSNYWFDNLGICKICDQSCSTCSNSNSCSTCQTGLIQASPSQLCQCPQSQWLDSGSITCLPCFFVCSSCSSAMNSSSQNCNSCKSDRVLVNGSCLCTSNDTRLFQDDTRCSQDQQAVLNIILSNNFLNLSIDFGIQIQPLFALSSSAQQICILLFEQQTQQLLGSGAQCSFNGSQINILLDGSARVLPGDVVNFKNNCLQYTYNQKPITQFYRNQVQMTDLPLQAQIKLGDYKQIQNYCFSQTIILQVIANDGGRGFKSISWTLNQILPTDSKSQQSFQITINQANQSQSQQIIIFLPMVQQDIALSFQVQWTLWIGQSGVQNANILILKKNFLSASHTFMQSPPYYVNQDVGVLYSVNSQICDEQGTILRIQQPLNIAIQNSEVGINLIQQSFNENEILVTIKAYSMKANNTYIIQASFTDASDSSITLTDSANLYITPSPLITKIVGGNRYASYQKAMIINSFLQDFEDYNSQEPNLGISISWSCQNLGVSKDCLNSKGQPLALQNDQKSLNISEYTFLPYQALSFNLKGTKIKSNGNSIVTRQDSDQIVAFITELDIPVLTVLLTDDLIIDPTINPNQLIHSLMVYDPTVNTDVLYYSGAIIYNDNVVGVIKFDFSFTRFQIWDYFNGFSSSNPSIQVRFSVYNPQYVLPSLCTINFVLNFPPSNCQLVANISTGYSLIDNFSFNLNNCQDENSPITYQFFYYTQSAQYNFELNNSQQIQRQQLTDKVLSNSVTTFLPGGQVIILAQAIDSKGAVSNSTITINVNYQSYSPNEFLELIKKFIQKSNTQLPEQRILNLNILSQDILNREKSFQSINIELSNVKLQIILQLQLISTQLVATSYFYQLADQTVSMLLKSNINLQPSDQMNQIQLIYSNLLSIQKKCEPSIISQTTYEKCLQDVYLTFNILDSLSTITKANTFSINTQFIDIVHQIGSILNYQSLPNENAIIFRGQNIQITAQQVTEKNIQLFTGIGSDQYKLRRNLQSPNSSSSQSDNQYIQNFIEKLNNSTSVYDATYNKFNINFYQQDQSFKNYTDQIFNYTKKQADIYPVIDPNIKNNQTNQPYNPQNGAIHYFNLTSNKNGTQNITCFNKQNHQNWSKSSCSTRINLQTNQAQCICNDLTPTTIIQDISDLFDNNKNIDTVFSSKGISNIENFSNFYEYVVFWVVFIQTFIFICLILYGKRLDSQYLYGNIPKSLRKKVVDSKSKIFPVSQQTQLDTVVKPNTPTDQVNINFTIQEEDDEKESPTKNVSGNLPNNIPSVFKLEQQQKNESNDEQTYEMKKKLKIKNKEDQKQNLNQKREEQMKVANKRVQIKSLQKINLTQIVEQNLNQLKEIDQNFNNKNANNQDFSHSDILENDANTTLGKNNQNNLDTSRPLSQTTIKQPTTNLRKTKTRSAQQYFDAEFLKYKQQTIEPSAVSANLIHLLPNISINNDNKDSKRESQSLNEINQNVQFMKSSYQSKVPGIFQTGDQRDQQIPQNFINQKTNVIQLPSIITLADQLSICTDNEQNKMQSAIQKLEYQNSNNSVVKKGKRDRKANKQNGLIIQNDLQQEQKEKINKISSFKYYAHFHEFLSVFLVFNYEVSRAVRFVLFYLRYQHSLAISILFGFDKTFVQKIFISIASSLIILIFSIFIEVLLTTNSFLKKVGVFLSILQAAFYVYVIISIISGDDPQSSNKFFITYIQFLVTEILVIQVLTALIFGVIAKNIINKQNEDEEDQVFFYKLFNLFKLNIIIQALLN
ncbi:hypothetical protein ABPG72_015618 [Tetrahymena utriculariae]